MIVRGATLSQLLKAADNAGVVVKGGDKVGRGIRFTLGLVSERWRRTSTSIFHEGRKVNAVCVHGHLEFFRRLYDLAPNALVIAGRDGTVRYESAADLEAKAPAVIDSNVGSQMYPVRYGDACVCGQEA